MYSLIGAMEGVILKAHYKDDDDNRSGVWTEYDIMEVSTRMRFRYARMISLFGSPDTGEEKTLTETTGTTDGTLLVMEDASTVSGTVVQTSDLSAGLAPTPTSKMNGSRVVFFCIGSAFTQAFIVGQVPHPEAQFYATRAQAPRSMEKVNGWTNTIANDGSLSFVNDKDGQQITFGKDGSALLQAKGGAKATLNADGSIDVIAAAEKQIRLGDTGLVPTLDGVVTEKGCRLFHRCSVFLPWGMLRQPCLERSSHATHRNRCNSR